MVRDTWHLITKSISSSQRWNWCVFATLLAGFGVLAFLVSRSDSPLVFVPLSWETKHFCEQPLGSEATGSDQFRIYVSAGFLGNDLCQRLSGNPEIGRRYSTVRAEWSLSGEVLNRLIFEHRFELLQLRPEEAQATGAPLSEVYRQISYYPPYNVFLIARDTVPVLTGEYLTSRIIGLLANTKSRSGYRVPLRVFGDLGLDPKHLQLRHYHSHQELRRALERGDVDVISSYWDTPQRAQFPDWHALRIGGVEQGLNWFLAEDVFENIQERCTVIHAIRAVEDASGHPYFAELRISAEAAEGCDDR